MPRPSGPVDDVRASGAVVRVAVDALGGDHAPDEVIAGAVQAASSTIEPVLFGPGSLDPHGLELVASTEAIAMHEKPAEAVRAKPDASLVRAVRSVGEGETAAVVSAGNTGAVLAASLLHVRRLPGVLRPGIAIVIPSKRGPTVLIDAGANADARPEHLVQFAHMGVVFAEEILDVHDPSVRLLSIGEEAEKGNQLTLDAHALLRNAGLRFEGNTEGRALLEGDADVVVCDGFTGNVALKTLEGNDPQRPRGAPVGDPLVGAGAGRRAAHPPGGARAPRAPRPRDVRRGLPARPARARRHRARVELARRDRERDADGRARGRAPPRRAPRRATPHGPRGGSRPGHRRRAVGTTG